MLDPVVGDKIVAPRGVMYFVSTQFICVLVCVKKPSRDCILGLCKVLTCSRSYVSIPVRSLHGARGTLHLIC